LNSTLALEAQKKSSRVKLYLISHSCPFPISLVFSSPHFLQVSFSIGMPYSYSTE